MGCVYKAFHHDNPRSIYAVKTLNRAEIGNQHLIRALQREAQMSSIFSVHPHIVNFIAHGWHGIEYYMVLEYIQGEMLLDRIKRAGKLSELEALKLILPIVQAEHFICDKGYLFRDLKPENVMIGKDNHVCLFDFGLTLPIEIAGEDQGMFMEGSPIYVPPERLTGEGEDFSSEIYSLGMVLYYAVAGQPFFTTADGTEGILKRHVSSFRLSGDLTKIGKLSPDFVKVLTKMKMRYPEERYQDFKTLEDEIYRLIAARDPSVKPKKKVSSLKLKSAVSSIDALKPKPSKPKTKEKPQLKIKSPPAAPVAPPSKPRSSSQFKISLGN
jgi:serine/threonine protein kinase